MKENTNNNKNENLPPNLYSLLFTNTNSNKLAELLDDTQSDNDFFQNNPNDNFFILDEKLKEERDKRLNEQDKDYKIKKHFFLKDSYEKIRSEEVVRLQFERLKEDDYLMKCATAEQRLNDGAHLTANDIYYVIRRNYPLFSKDDKDDIGKVQSLYKAYNAGNLLATGLIVSYLRAIMLFFRKELFKSRFASYVFLFAYGAGTYFAMNHFINLSYENKMGRYCYKNIDLILDFNNEPFKTPYDESEKNFNPEEKSLIDIFKF